MTTSKVPIYAMDRVGPIGFNSYGGVDHRVFIDSKPFGCINAFEFIWQEGFQEKIKLIGLAYVTSLCAPADIPKTINGKKIEILAANEYGNIVRVLGDRILWVREFHLPVSVDDVIVEWTLEGSLEDSGERTPWRGEYNLYNGKLSPEPEKNKLLEALSEYDAAP